MSSIEAAERSALADGRHSAPHNVLGPHEHEEKGRRGTIVRVYQPDAADVSIIREGVATAMRDEGEGFFSIFLPSTTLPFRYALRFIGPDGHAWERGDPYRHEPTLGEMDLYLFNEGTHRRLWTRACRVSSLSSAQSIPALPIPNTDRSIRETHSKTSLR